MLRLLTSLCVAAMLSLGSAAYADSPFRFDAKMEAGKPAECRLKVVYPASGQWKFYLTLTEFEGGNFFESLATPDKKFYRQTIRLVIDGSEALAVKVGGELKGEGYAAGITFTPGKLGGRETMDKIITAAERATSIRFIAPGIKVQVPTEGLAEALRNYRQCRTERAV